MIYNIGYLWLAVYIANIFCLHTLIFFLHTVNSENTHFLNHNEHPIKQDRLNSKRIAKNCNWNGSNQI